MQISRLFEIVYILMNKQNTTAKELSEHFEVSQRTIYRDIETLCQAGIPIYTTKGKGGGIALMEHFVLNKSILTEQEQNEILAALSGFRAATNSDSDQIIHKLAALFGNTGFDWIEVDFSNWNRHEQEQNKFQWIKEAILHHNVLSFHYYNSNGQNSLRSIEPYKLVFRGQSWYLYGYCRDKKDTRYFKITRMSELKSEPETFTVDPSMTKPIQEHSTSSASPDIEVILQIDREMGFRVYDEFPPENIKRNEDGSFLVHTKLQGGNWLSGYLMSYEDHLTILEPVELREEIITKFKNTLSRYYGLTEL